MTRQEIEDTYEDMSEYDAFEVYDSNGVTPFQISAILGKDAADCFVQWIYRNVK